jgi:hypothetical protein
MTVLLPTYPVQWTRQSDSEALAQSNVTNRKMHVNSCGNYSFGQADVNRPAKIAQRMGEWRISTSRFRSTLHSPLEVRLRTNEKGALKKLATCNQSKPDLRHCASTVHQGHLRTRALSFHSTHVDKKSEPTHVTTNQRTEMTVRALSMKDLQALMQDISSDNRYLTALRTPQNASRLLAVGQEPVPLTAPIIKVLNQELERTSATAAAASASASVMGDLVSMSLHKTTPAQTMRPSPLSRRRTFQIGTERMPAPWNSKESTARFLSSPPANIRTYPIRLPKPNPPSSAPARLVNFEEVVAMPGSIEQRTYANLAERIWGVKPAGGTFQVGRPKPRSATQTASTTARGGSRTATATVDNLFSWLTPDPERTPQWRADVMRASNTQVYNAQLQQGLKTPTVGSSKWLEWRDRCIYEHPGAVLGFGIVPGVCDAHKDLTHLEDILPRSDVPFTAGRSVSGSRSFLDSVDTQDMEPSSYAAASDIDEAPLFLPLDLTAMAQGPMVESKTSSRLVAQPGSKETTARFTDLTAERKVSSKSAGGRRTSSAATAAPLAFASTTATKESLKPISKKPSSAISAKSSMASLEPVTLSHKERARQALVSSSLERSGKEDRLTPVSVSRDFVEDTGARSIQPVELERSITISGGSKSRRSSLKPVSVPVAHYSTPRRTRDSAPQELEPVRMTRQERLANDSGLFEPRPRSSRQPMRPVEMTDQDVRRQHRSERKNVDEMQPIELRQREQVAVSRRGGGDHQEDLVSVEIASPIGQSGKRRKRNVDIGLTNWEEADRFADEDPGVDGLGEPFNQRAHDMFLMS